MGISDIFQDSAADNLLRAIRYLSLDLCLDLRRMGVNAIVLELGLEVGFLWELLDLLLLMLSLLTHD